MFLNTTERKVAESLVAHRDQHPVHKKSPSFACECQSSVTLDHHLDCKGQFDLAIYLLTITILASSCVDLVGSSFVKARLATPHPLGSFSSVRALAIPRSADMGLISSGPECMRYCTRLCATRPINAGRRRPCNSLDWMISRSCQAGQLGNGGP